jgi:hypothetical protein
MTVQDTTLPVISGLSVATCSLLLPNHKLVVFTVMANDT